MAVFTATVFFLAGKENSSGKDSHEKTKKIGRDKIKKPLLAGYRIMGQKVQLVNKLAGAV